MNEMEKIGNTDIEDNQEIIEGVNCEIRKRIYKNKSVSQTVEY